MARGCAQAKGKLKLEVDVDPAELFLTAFSSTLRFADAPRPRETTQPIRQTTGTSRGAHGDRTEANSGPGKLWLEQRAKENLRTPLVRKTPWRGTYNDLGDHTADAAAGQTDHAGGTFRKIQHTTADERTAIIDGDDHAAAAMGDPQPGSERQMAMGGGHGVLIEALAGCGAATGFIAVIGGHAENDRLESAELPKEALAFSQDDPLAPWLFA